jgi:transcriptional pleiotropic regulator of transition state genes
VKSIGMSRKVDDLGRIVLPVELRRQLGIRAGDELDISVDGAMVLLSKIESRCVFCDSVDQLRGYREKQVCGSCVTALAQPGGAPAPAPAAGSSTSAL